MYQKKIINYNFLLFIISFTGCSLSSLNSNSEQSLREPGNIDSQAKLIQCQSEDTTIYAKAMGKVYRCNKRSEFGIQPNHHFSNSVFISCNPDHYTGGNLPTCKNIAIGLAELNTGVTINLVVKKEFVNSEAVSEVIRDIKSVTSKNKITVNILETKSNPSDFMRDPQIVSFDQKSKDYLISLMPNDQLSARASKEAQDQCRNTVVERAFYPVSKGLFFKTGLISSEDQEILYNSDRPTGLRSKQSRRLSSFQLEGGNILGLPGGKVALVETEFDLIPEQIEEYFREKNIDIVKVKLPKIGVGHIDEIFNIVPPKKPKCNFAILVASQRSLKNWINSNKEILSSYMKNSYMTEAYQDSIDEATDQIWDIVKLESSCKKEEVFVEIPMAWARFGPVGEESTYSVGLLPNPVNGLHINGRYLMSKIRLRNQQRMGEYHPGLEKFVNDILAKKTGIKKTLFVDTSFTDGISSGSGGNIHCATFNIPLRCY